MQATTVDEFLWIHSFGLDCASEVLTHYVVLHIIIGIRTVKEN